MSLHRQKIRPLLWLLLVTSICAATATLLTGCTTQLQTPYVRSYGHAHFAAPTLTYALIYGTADCTGDPIGMRFTDGPPVLQGTASG